MPIDLIELQPVYHQRGARGSSGGAWQPQWQGTRSTKCDYLLRRLRDLGIVPPPQHTSLPHWEEYVPPPEAAEAAAGAPDDAADAAVAEGGIAGGGAAAAASEVPGSHIGAAGGGAASAAGSARDVRVDAAGSSSAAAVLQGDPSLVNPLSGADEMVQRDAGDTCAELNLTASHSRAPVATTSAANVAAGAMGEGEAATGTGTTRDAPAQHMSGDGCTSMHDSHAHVSSTAVAALPRQRLAAAPPQHQQGTLGLPGPCVGRPPRTRRVTFISGEVSAKFEYPVSPRSSSEGAMGAAGGACEHTGPDEEAGATHPPGSSSEGAEVRLGSRTPSPVKGRPPCMHRRSLARPCKLPSILRKHSSFPRPGEYVPGPHEASAPPPVVARPQRGRRRGRHALIDVETATDRRSAQHGAAAGGGGGGPGHSVLGSAEAAASSTLDAPGAEGGEEKAIVFTAFWHHLMLVEKHLMDANAIFVVRFMRFAHPARQHICAPSDCAAVPVGRHTQVVRVSYSTRHRCVGCHSCIPFMRLIFTI